MDDETHQERQEDRHADGLRHIGEADADVAQSEPVEHLDGDGHHDDRQERDGDQEAVDVAGFAAHLELFAGKDRRHRRHRHGQQGDLDRHGEVEERRQDGRHDGNDEVHRDQRPQQTCGGRKASRRSVVASAKVDRRPRASTRSKMLAVRMSLTSWATFMGAHPPPVRFHSVGVILRRLAQVANRSRAMTAAARQNGPKSLVATGRRPRRPAMGGAERETLSPSPEEDVARGDYPSVSFILFTPTLIDLLSTFAEVFIRSTNAPPFPTLPCVLTMNVPGLSGGYGQSCRGIRADRSRLVVDLERERVLVAVRHVYDFDPYEFRAGRAIGGVDRLGQGLRSCVEVVQGLLVGCSRAGRRCRRPCGRVSDFVGEPAPTRRPHSSQEAPESGRRSGMRRLVSEPRSGGWGPCYGFEDTMIGVVMISIPSSINCVSSLSNVLPKGTGTS